MSPITPITRAPGTSTAIAVSSRTRRLGTKRGSSLDAPSTELPSASTRRTTIARATDGSSAAMLDASSSNAAREARRSSGATGTVAGVRAGEGNL
jgi:hypothetical protein